MVTGNITLPVVMRTRVVREEYAIFYVPEIVGHWHPYVEREINWHMYETIRQLAKKQYIEQGAEKFSEMISTYEVKANERNILSVTFTNYAYADGFAHGLTLMDALTFDVTTGKKYSLSDIFKSNSDYDQRLTEIVKRQIKEREIPTFDESVTVSATQPFYLADISLVLFYPLYAITPYYYGIPKFPISVYELESIVAEDGPLGRMIG